MVVLLFNDGGKTAGLDQGSAETFLILSDQTCFADFFKNQRCAALINQTEVAKRPRLLALSQWIIFGCNVVKFDPQYGYRVVNKREYSGAIESINSIYPSENRSCSYDDFMTEDNAFARYAINEYWEAVEDIHHTVEGTPWSAAFIAWALKASLDSEALSFSANHSNFISYNRGSFDEKVESEFYTSSSQFYFACFFRPYSKKSDHITLKYVIEHNHKPMHCDIYIGENKNELFFVGGNINDTVSLIVFNKNDFKNSMRSKRILVLEWSRG